MSITSLSRGAGTTTGAGVAAEEDDGVGVAVESATASKSSSLRSTSTASLEDAAVPLTKPWLSSFGEGDLSALFDQTPYLSKARFACLQTAEVLQQRRPKRQPPLSAKLDPVDARCTCCNRASMLYKQEHRHQIFFFFCVCLKSSRLPGQSASLPCLVLSNVMAPSFVWQLLHSFGGREPTTGGRTRPVAANDPLERTGLPATR